MGLESDATKNTHNKKKLKSIPVIINIWLDIKIRNPWHLTHRRPRTNKTFLVNLPMFPFLGKK